MDRDLLDNCLHVQACKDHKCPACEGMTEESQELYDPEETLVEGMSRAKELYVKTHKMSPKALERLAAYDPTEQKKYIEWMARVWVKERLRKDDLEKFEVVKAFEDMTKRNIITAPKNDINQYKTIEELYDEVKQHEGVKTKTEQEEEVKGNAEKVFSNEKVLIVFPKDKEASCIYGKGTKWCTAATEYSNYFNSYYYDRYVNLYYVIPKGDLMQKYGKIAVAVERDGSKTYYDAQDNSHDEAWFKPIGKELGIPGYEGVKAKAAKKEKEPEANVPAAA